MGDLKSARSLAEKALAIRKAALGERHPLFAESLNLLAQVLQAMGDHEAALPLMERALAISKAVPGEKHPSHGVILSNLAQLLAERGDHDGALPLAEKALAIREAALGKTHPDCANSLNNLAFLHRAMGNPKAALPLFKRALAIRKESLGETHPQYATSLHNLSVLYSDAGDGKALDLSERALAVLLDQSRRDAAGQSDRQQLAAAALLRRFLDHRLALADLDKHPPAVLAALAWKGQILARQQQRRLFLRLSADPACRLEVERVRSLVRQLAALRASPSATRQRLEALEQELDEAQAALSARSAAFRAEAGKARPAPEDIAAALPDGAVLVDYLFHGSEGKRGLAAFVHQRGHVPERFHLGLAAPTEAAARKWRALLAEGKPDARASAALKELVLAPLAKRLVGAKTLLVSPDGVLGTVPFAALPGKAKGTYLIEDVPVAVVPVPQLLPGLLAPMDRLAPSLLVVGGVDYGKATAAPRLSGARGAPPGMPRKWGALPGTAAEAASVARSFAAAFKREAVVLSKQDAASGKVRAALERTRYAHLATHGYFAPEDVKSALAGPRRAEDQAPADWNPLLLSGLAFAGANRAPEPGEEDGILTALEVSEMDLTRLELAVLSACETGLGKEAGGEGLLGMQRAFQAAGARSVVASLWQVDDEATRRLMTDFYAQAWDAKSAASRAEALRRAQLAMLFGKTLEGKPRGAGKVAEKLPKGEGGRAHPFYWAAFVLSGDWR